MIFKVKFRKKENNSIFILVFIKVYFLWFYITYV